jgi:DNA-binding GntR family transcriptional regulator
MQLEHRLALALAEIEAVRLEAAAGALTFDPDALRVRMAEVCGAASLCRDVLSRRNWCSAIPEPSDAMKKHRAFVEAQERPQKEAAAEATRKHRAFVEGQRAKSVPYYAVYPEKGAR